MFHLISVAVRSVILHS